MWGLGLGVRERKYSLQNEKKKKLKMDRRTGSLDVAYYILYRSYNF